ncbi:MAG: discoidin domain-containing protein [Nitrospirae bacterium]|nr:discoidin domain-containing protein [Nitrospirota bacterium]
MGTTLLISDRKVSLWILFFIIVLPFILLYWMVPFVSDLTLGADYQIYSINEQVELLFSIKTGSVPLYAPGYKYGHSSSALTLSQVYHPISHIASLMPGYWNGKALEWNTFLRLLSLGFVHLALFTFLRKIRLNLLFAFLISFITVYNMRMLEAFRYGASLEAFTGNLLLCTATGCYFVSPSRWFGPLSIIGFTYLLVCSGHPPMMFYGLIGAGLFTLVTPFFIATMLPEIDVNLKIALRFWAKAGFYVCLGIMLSSAYVVPFYFEFVTTNIEYAHMSYQSDMGQDTIVGALNNFFMPLVSDVLSSFGGSALILIVLVLPLLRCVRVKVPPSVWAIWGMLLFAFFYILGPQTPIYKWAFKYLPFVSSVGGVGRISIIIPSLMMLPLAWIVNAGTFSFRFKKQDVVLTPFIFLGLIALILIPLYLLPVFLLKPALGYFTPHFLRKIPFRIEFLSVFFGMASLAALVLYEIYPRLKRVLGIFLCLMVLLQMGTILKYGTFIEKKVDNLTFQQMKVQKKEKLDFNFRQNPGLFHAVVLNHLSHSFMEPFLGKIYTQIIPVSSQDNAYKEMERERLPQQVFAEGYDLEKAKVMNEKNKNVKAGTVNLAFSSFNRLQFKVISPAPAIFGMAYPFTGHWRVWVNGEKVHVYRANGIAHAIEIPDGESLVEFRYWSKPFFWGMIVSCLTFAVIGLFVCFRGLKGLPRITGAVIVLIISAGGFMFWYNSLYRGHNLDTAYTWTYIPPANTPNLAYGKKTVVSYPLDSSEKRFDSSSAVDGYIKPGAGFSFWKINEALIVDLKEPQRIKTIVLYGEFKTNPEISFSQNGTRWQMGSFVIVKDSKNIMRIIFEKPMDALFVKVKAIDSVLTIDEVEIYGCE